MNIISVTSEHKSHVLLEYQEVRYRVTVTTLGDNYREQETEVRTEDDELVEDVLAEEILNQLGT